MLDVDCDIVAGEWDPQQDWAALAERAVAAALAGAGYGDVVAGKADVEVSIRLGDDEEVRRLNRDYRGMDKPTNVLAFPMHAPADIPRIIRSSGLDVLIGDIALAAETVVAQAETRQVSIADHATHLIVHGTLHLLGHDHGDDASAEEMEALETRILASLGIADPYRAGVCHEVDERQ